MTTVRHLRQNSAIMCHPGNRTSKCVSYCKIQACQSRTGKLVCGLDVSKDRDGMREKNRDNETEQEVQKTHVVKERGGNEQNSKTERWNWHLRSPVQTDRAETRGKGWRESKRRGRNRDGLHQGTWLAFSLWIEHVCIPSNPGTLTTFLLEKLCVITHFISNLQ